MSATPKLVSLSKVSGSSLVDRKKYALGELSLLYWVLLPTRLGY
jgi:hypothetical protein